MKPTHKEVQQVCHMIENGDRGLELAIHQFNSQLRGLPPIADKPTFPRNAEEMKRLSHRIFHILEEVEEAVDAKGGGDLVGVADAMADVVYLALGVCHDLGIPFNAVFAEVHRSNMTKERVKDASESKRNDPHDLKKGPTFSPADVKSVLLAHGAEL